MTGIRGGVVESGGTDIQIEQLSYATDVAINISDSSYVNIAGMAAQSINVSEAGTYEINLSIYSVYCQPSDSLFQVATHINGSALSLPQFHLPGSGVYDSVTLTSTVALPSGSVSVYPQVKRITGLGGFKMENAAGTDLDQIVITIKGPVV